MSSENPNEEITFFNLQLEELDRKVGFQDLIQEPACGFQWSYSVTVRAVEGFESPLTFIQAITENPMLEGVSEA